MSYKTYLQFLSSGNGTVFFIFLLLISVTSQASTVTTDWWLSQWSDNFVKIAGNGSNRSVNVLDEKSTFGLTNRMTIIIYSCLLISAWMLTTARCILCIKLVMDSARNFHHRMLQSVLHAPIHFFDVNPVGNKLQICINYISNI